MKGPLVSSETRLERRTMGEGGDRLGVRVHRTSVVAAELGLLSLFLMFVTFALFGPWFTYSIGLGLFGTAAGLGAVALLLGHRAAHKHRRTPALVGRRFATLGSVCGGIAILVCASYIGVLYLLLVSAALVPAIVLGTVALALHLGARQSEASFLRTVDLGSATAACGICGTRTPLSAGRWGFDLWRCPKCAANPWGSYA